MHREPPAIAENIGTRVRTSSVALGIKRHDGAALGSDQSPNDLIASFRVVSPISLPFVSSTQAL
jgi:hypothetical protein